MLGISKFTHPPHRSAVSARALIFDFDGLIIDTEWPLYDSWRLLYQEHGHNLDLETYVECVGSTTLRFDPAAHLCSLVGESHPSRAPELQQRHSLKVREILDQCDTLPGVRERLEEARKMGLPLAIASSSTSDWIHPWLERLGLTEYFTVIRTRDQVSQAKPSPELFLTATERLGVAPDEALVFEDSFHGLQAARAAQIPCVAVPNRVTEQSDFTAAALILESLAALSLEEILRRVYA